MTGQCGRFDRYPRTLGRSTKTSNAPYRGWRSFGGFFPRLASRATFHRPVPGLGFVVGCTGLRQREPRVPTRGSVVSLDASTCTMSCCEAPSSVNRVLPDFFTAPQQAARHKPRRYPKSSRVNERGGLRPDVRPRTNQPQPISSFPAPRAGTRTIRRCRVAGPLAAPRTRARRGVGNSSAGAPAEFRGCPQLRAQSVRRVFGGSLP